MSGPGTYRYRLKSTGGSSQRYGPCEVCAKPASEVFIQVEEQAYRIDSEDRPAFLLPPDEGGGIGWTQHECVTLFGHEECLLGRRR